jgi:hypothetical protein
MSLHRLHCTAAFMALGLALASPALAQFKAAGALQVIDYPGGAQVVYGPINGVSAMPQAMSVMLRAVHDHLGARPEVGRLFQTKGSSSMAAFFNIPAVGGKSALTGMIIVSIPPGGPASGAVLYDEQKRFPKTSSDMMKKLNAAWKPPLGSAAPTRNGPAASLQRTAFPDNSGSVALPQGWRITGGYQGAVHAEGPNGSQIHYGVVYPVMDPNNPQQRQMIQMQTQGGRSPLPGSYVAYPSGGNPVHAMIAISAQAAQKARQPAPTYQISSVKDEGIAPGGHCTRAIGQVDRHDGKGVLAANTVICVSQPNNGLWMMTLYQDAVRPQLLAQEQATMEAISKSYRINNQVIAQESQSTINRIHQIGDESRRQAEQSHAAFDQRNADLASAEDRRDRRNQDFSNYILDNTVVRDAQTGEHATTYNSYADALVKSDPNRYQYVPNQSFLKGVDY